MHRVDFAAHGHKFPFKSSGIGSSYQREVPVFDNLIANESSHDIEAELLDHKFIFPKKSCVYMVCVQTISKS